MNGPRISVVAIPTASPIPLNSRLRRRTNARTLFPNPNSDRYYIAYLKDDPAKEPIEIGDSIPRILADAQKTGRPETDFEVHEISQERDEGLKHFLFEK